MRKLTVCGVDIAEFAIVLPAIPDPCEKRAAEFLQRVIKEACGAELPISDRAEHGIILGKGVTEGIKWDGFSLSTDEKNLYLTGIIPRGTLYAAYDFAEKYLGSSYEPLSTQSHTSYPGVSTVL